ncbi:MAG: SGNH/GDSL hydrolase family protein [Pirellulaceae bacterium]|nr:SGNH/GDSL hydrolase family protein [Pirellulaceae bacterium]
MLVALCVLTEAARAEVDGKLQILLMGDSTCIGSFCRMTDPDGPHLEDVIKELLAGENDLPAANVINKGVNGDFLDRLLSGDRYDRQIASLPGLDYVFIRYGINDSAKRNDFETNFPDDYHLLIGRLRKDHPDAKIVLMTIIPFMGPQRDTVINSLIHQVADQENLPLVDIHKRYSQELQHGPKMLSYRRVKWERIPENLRSLVQSARHGGDVVVMDNQLDAHLRDVPGWHNDQHPNLAGYHVIADETAKFLIGQLRANQQ